MAWTRIALDCVDLDETDHGDNAARATPDERERASRFRSPVDVRRFLARRVHLRMLLAEALGRQADDIAFSLGKFGKPSIADSSLSFSTSHSNGLFLTAIGKQRLGCDVERRDPGCDLMNLATLTFTASEMRWFTGLGQSKRADAFYDRWTRKEAYLKAIGVGLSMAMTDFAMSPDPLRIVTAEGSNDQWSAVSWSPRPGYQAALVAESGGWRVGHRQSGLPTPGREEGSASAFQRFCVVGNGRNTAINNTR